MPDRQTEMNTAPLVTIAIPAYKGRYLKQAIDSALAQTCRDIELVIVDDRSPDHLADIIAGYDDTRIRYFVNERNIGSRDPAANWNKCLEYARGEFFALLCDDDLYEPGFVEELLALAAGYPGCAVFRARAKVIGAGGETVDLYPSSPVHETAHDYLWHLLGGFRRQSISEFLVRTETMRSTGGYVSFPRAWCADSASVLRFAGRGGIASTDRILASFRMSGCNISSQTAQDACEKMQAYRLYYRWIEDYATSLPDPWKRLIAARLAERKRDTAVWCLSLASRRDLVHMWRHRKDDTYCIDSKCFARAMLRRLRLRGGRTFKR